MNHLRAVPVDLAEANAFVSQHHRHHKPVVGHLWSTGAALGERIVGVVIVGRPISRRRDDGLTVEVTRLCTDGTRNACSFLYGAAARAAFARGYMRIGTYTLPSEGGQACAAPDGSLSASAGVDRGRCRRGHASTSTRCRKNSCGSVNCDHGRTRVSRHDLRRAWVPGVVGVRVCDAGGAQTARLRRGGVVVRGAPGQGRGDGQGVRACRSAACGGGVVRAGARAFGFLDWVPGERRN